MSLILHCGAKKVSRSDVINSSTPEATRTHITVPHSHVLSETERLLKKMGFLVKEEAHALAHKGKRYFGMYDLENDYKGYDTVLGIRNSHDKSMAYGAVLGDNTTVCDNLAFWGEYKFSRKHTKNVYEDLEVGMKEMFIKIPEYEKEHNEKLEKFRKVMVSDDTVHSTVINAARKKVISSSKILSVVDEFENPSYEEFREEGKNLFRLKQAFTTVMKRHKNIFDTPKRTINLNDILTGISDEYIYGIGEELF